MRPLGGCFGASWGLFWASWGPPGASWGPLGGPLGPLGGLSGLPEALLGRKARIFGPRSPSGPPLGPVLGPSWAVLGASWVVLGPSWAVLGRSWRPLGPYWGALGGVLGRLGASESRKGTLDILPKSARLAFTMSDTANSVGRSTGVCGYSTGFWWKRRFCDRLSSVPGYKGVFQMARRSPTPWSKHTTAHGTGTHEFHGCTFVVGGNVAPNTAATRTFGQLGRSYGRTSMLSTKSS